MRALIALPQKNAWIRDTPRKPHHHCAIGLLAFGLWVLCNTVAAQALNPNPQVPPQCYTDTQGGYNPCWVCHTQKEGRNLLDDWKLQEKYPDSVLLSKNHWGNLLAGASGARRKIGDEDILKYVREDNYSKLLQGNSLRGHLNQKPIPDLDFRRGFDSDGFAKDGSGWRAFRYKPFPGTFWPTNGSTDDVLIRLPAKFRNSVAGVPSKKVYKANLAVLEALMQTQESPLDAAQPKGSVPLHYVGAAALQPAIIEDYPIGTEFLHTVRYLDPNAPGMSALRVKEVRYAFKKYRLDPLVLESRYAAESSESAEETKRLARVQPATDVPVSGVNNGYGWRYFGFIENERGELRSQTREEHAYCIGCHGGIGITIDASFSFPRKVPGAKGWGYQSLKGMPDAPQRGSLESELSQYFKRAGAGDEYRSNEEMRVRYFKDGVLNAAALCNKANDLASVLLPSTRRALELDKAYRVIVTRQSFAQGRDAWFEVKPKVIEAVNVASSQTDLSRAQVYKKASLRLDWSEQAVSLARERLCQTSVSSVGAP
jgi:hypothetical protein